MGNIKIGSMVMGAVGTNCYFVYREGSSDCLFFDPADKGDYIYNALKEKGFNIKSIYLTHGHFDHIWGSNKLREVSDAQVHALDLEKELCADPHMNVSEMAGRAYTATVDEYISDGDEITDCDITFKVIATPGHTGGSCCYYFEEAGFLICGDTLFQESVGRTDFPTGSAATLTRSIREKLMALPDDTKCYPGHGASTTIGYERENNPFI